MPIVRVGRRGQVTIPSDVRRDLDLRDGERMILLVRGDEILLQPIGPPIFALRGSIPVSEPQDFAAIRAETLRLRARHAAGEAGDG